jgi:exodeoxyribonuclease-3
MKVITSWNVNGLRSVIKKGALARIQSIHPNILCLQEIKAKPFQVTKESLEEYSGYYSYWNSAERPGYSGVATFSEFVPLFVERGMFNRNYYGEGRIITTKFKNFLLINVYFPNGRRNHSRLKYKLDFYSVLLEYCDNLHSKGESIIICGDFNTAHEEIDLKNPNQNKNTSGFLPEERIWLDRYLEHGFIDIFRQRYPEKIQYSWWTYRYDARSRNIGWRLDYFFISQHLIPAVRDVIIHEDIQGSDHCPVSLYIENEWLV